MRVMINRNHPILVITLLYVMFSVALLSAQEPLVIRAIVDRTTVAVNQQLVLTLEISGDGANKIDFPAPPDLGDYLKLAGSGGNSQNIQFINGKMSVTKSQVYFYIAAMEGTCTIAPIKISYKNSEAESEPVTITVTKSGAPPASATPAPAPGSEVDTGEDLFIRALPSKRTVYQNEPVIVSYRIYKSAKVNLTNYGINKLPESVGFWAEEIDVGNQPPVWEEVINGKKFVLADIKKTILFPASPGKKTVGPLGIDCNIRVATQKRSSDIFDNFFDDPFFSRTVRKTIFSQTLDINVLALPQENKPANFSGCVGRFNMDASIDKNQVTTNQAITLKIKISGTGNVKIIPKPDLIIPADFQQYDPKTTENIVRNHDGVSGSKTFEYVLVPRFPGEQRIKPVSFSYFDPYSKAYKILNTPEFILQVEKGSDELLSMGSGLSKEEVRLVGQDIRFIKLATGKMIPGSFKFYNQFLFFAAIILPMLALAGALGYNHHLTKLSANVAYARRRRANTMAMKKLAKAKGLLDDKTQKEFYAEISRALSGFAADKLNLSQAGIISDELEELLKKHHLDETLIKEYIELVQACDFQRFAPANVGSEEMQEFFKKAKEAIINLEKAL